MLKTWSRKPTCGPSGFLVVSEAAVCALGYSKSCGTRATPGWIRIVRNTLCWNLTKNYLAPILSRQPPEEALSRNDDRKLVRRALAELPPSHREVLILRELEGMSYKEISEIMDMPAGTVMSRLSRARDGLRQSLANLGHESTLPNCRRVVAQS